MAKSLASKGLVIIIIIIKHVQQNEPLLDFVSIWGFEEPQR